MPICQYDSSVYKIETRMHIRASLLSALPLYICRCLPHDSVLGPLLFLIYVNVVADNMLSKCRLFVDNNFLHVLHVVEKWSNTAL